MEQRTSKYRLQRRRITYFTLVFITTVVGTWLFADNIWGKTSDLTALQWALLLVFIPLFYQLASGSWVAALGVWVRYVQRKNPLSIEATLPLEKEHEVPLASTAIIVPVFNEDVDRVFAGVRSVYESVKRTGNLDSFDIFILSDSDNPNRWVEEEIAWMNLVQSLDAFGKIFYRKRRQAINRKSGNVADFCRRWGKRYRYMIVFDADSVMSGETMSRMVRLMEKNPQCGILQTPPRHVNADTIFGRIFQFANSLYGPIFMAGLNYWQAGESTFWGHNAIIRLAPFIQYCALPDLPGKEPFGGRILSHDLVEAALMRKAGYAVWLAPELTGSFEEGPPTLVDSLKRDRRWCQGNLQHSWLLFAKGWRGMSRLNLFQGVLSYLVSPLWFSFLILATLSASHWRDVSVVKPDPDSFHIVEQIFPSSNPEKPLDPQEQAWANALKDVFRTVRNFTDETPSEMPMYVLLGLTVCLLFLPKFGIAFLVLCSRRRSLLFGGRGAFILSFILESIFFFLLAPILMVFHARFVLLILFGQGVRWITQRRNISGGLDWREPVLTFGGTTLLGLAWGASAYMVYPVFFWWILPVLLGMVLSIPFAIITSHPMRYAPKSRSGLFRTPELVAEPLVLRELRANLAAMSSKQAIFDPIGTDHAMQLARLDPYINSLYNSLVSENKSLPEDTRRSYERLLDQTLGELRRNVASIANRYEPIDVLRADHGLALVMLDPYINALHCVLLRERKSLPSESRIYYGRIRARILSEGPGVVARKDKLALLYDADSLAWLHRKLWSLPASQIAECWRVAMRQYNIISKEEPLERV
ncbi:MAG: glucans biosynthesis glucosyltransferase MdoH [Puniceicoccales bacterium]|jgi:membrane glycosyltransferase|nr:glucans biosynthesis glucosyltransferase MdoH [Puniceicoccales bacterium]